MKIVLLLVAALLSGGCVYVHVPGKFTYLAPAFGTKTIQRVDLESGVLEGYRSEQSEMTEALSSGIAAGVAKGLKP